MVNKMKAKTLLSLLMISVLIPSIAKANIGLRDISFNGHIKCGVDLSTRTYVDRNEDGEFEGIAVDVCKAYAQAIFMKDDAYKIIDANTLNANKGLSNGQIDIMIGAHEIIPSQNAKSIMAEVDILLYEPQTFLVRKKDSKNGDVKQIKISDYKGSKICSSTNPDEIYKINKYSTENNLDMIILPFSSQNRIREAFMLKRCEVMTGDYTYLTSIFNNNLKQGEEFEVLKEAYATNPIYIYAKNTNLKNIDTFKQIFNTLKLADALDINSLNIDITKASQNPIIQNLLGDNEKIWREHNVRPTWARTYLKNVGSYDEIYKKHIGKDSIFMLDHPYNTIVDHGGMLTYRNFL